MIRLLDVNVIVALLWEDHVHHEQAHPWFTSHRAEGWATCCLTELGFTRISMQTAELKAGLNFADAFAALMGALSDPHHQFWPLDYSFSQILPEIRAHVRGHRQLTDALLLDLAIRHQGRLVTFDKNVCKLLPPDSPHQAAVELLA